MATIFTDINKVPEKSLKGSSVSNAVALANTRPAPAPNPSIFSSQLIHGSIGRTVVYNLLYRSRSALQMLGCIPQSPSPTIEISDNDARPREVAREVQNLRARLALLERGLNVKTEPRARLKREREDGVENAGPRRRSRRSTKIEIVDLTDD